MKADYTVEDLKRWRRVGLWYAARKLIIAATPLLLVIGVSLLLNSEDLLGRLPIRVAVGVLALGCMAWLGFICWRALAFLEDHIKTAFTCSQCNRKLLGLHLDWAIWFGRCRNTRTDMFEKDREDI